jgi:hypothetical protein
MRNCLRTESSVENLVTVRKLGYQSGREDARSFLLLDIRSS